MQKKNCIWFITNSNLAKWISKPVLSTLSMVRVQVPARTLVGGRIQNEKVGEVTFLNSIIIYPLKSLLLFSEETIMLSGQVMWSLYSTN